VSDKIKPPHVERKAILYVRQSSAYHVQNNLASQKLQYVMLYEALEERGVSYAIRIPANENLERDIAELLPRPVGRSGLKPLVEYKSFLYQAASWKRARRVVAKVEHHQGELFPRVGFIVRNLSLPSRAVVRFYNKPGTAEQWIKEGKQAVKMTWLSCHRFRANEVRLQLSVLAYNLGNLWRRLVLPKRIDHCSLTSLQQRLVKTGGRLVKHARYYWLRLAEGHLTRRVFAAFSGGSGGCPWVSPGGHGTGRTDGEEKEGGTVECRRIGPRRSKVAGWLRPGRAPPTFHWYW